MVYLFLEVAQHDLSTHASNLIIYTKTLLEYANSACPDFIHDIASRMESQGIPGEIQISEATYQLLKDKFIFEQRGTINVKGKGEMVTYLLKSVKW